MPRLHFDWPAQTLEAWKRDTRFSNEKIAFLVRQHDRRLDITAQAVSDYLQGNTNLPAGLVPVLQTIAPKHAHMWDEVMAIERGEVEPPTEDHLTAEQRSHRTITECGELLAKLGAALVNHEIDATEIPGVLAEARDLRDEVDRLIDLLSAPRLERAGRRV